MVNTKDDAIIASVESGSFRLDIQFEIMNTHFKVSDAVFDTGCSHSLISVNTLSLNDSKLAELRNRAIYDKRVIISRGKGVESRGYDKSLLNIIDKLNMIKSKASNNKELVNLIHKYMKKSEIDTLLNSINARFEFVVDNFCVGNINLGRIAVRFSFKTNNTCLIGMHIIRQLRTEIYSKNGEIILIATKNSDKAKALIENYKLHVDDLLDDIQVVESNYVNKVSKKE